MFKEVPATLQAFPNHIGRLDWEWTIGSIGTEYDHHFGTR